MSSRPLLFAMFLASCAIVYLRGVGVKALVFTVAACGILYIIESVCMCTYSNGVGSVYVLGVA